jgi:hypothetical protein
MIVIMRAVKQHRERGKKKVVYKMHAVFLGVITNNSHEGWFFGDINGP